MNKKDSIDSICTETFNDHDKSTGDICAVLVTGCCHFIIASVYIYNNKTENQILDLFKSFLDIVPTNSPVIICGNFNIDILKQKNASFLEYGIYLICHV